MKLSFLFFIFVFLFLFPDGPGPTLQSSCSLDALLDLKVQQLEAELEGAQNQAEGAFQREKAMRAEVQRLQHEVAKLREAQRQVPHNCFKCLTGHDRVQMDCRTL